MPHHCAPPIEIDGFDHPQAFTNIPTARRPDWGSTRCATCSGHGRRNAVLHPDSLRCVIEGCADCDGSGWLSSDGTRHLPDVVIIDGIPSWVVRTVRAGNVVDFPAAGEEGRRLRAA